MSQLLRETTLALIGAGHAHVEVLRRFGARPMAGIRLVLVTRELNTPYSGMLPGVIAGLYLPQEAHIDARALATSVGAQFIHGEAVGLDLSTKRIICRDGREISYDVVSIDLGAAPNTREVTGVAEHAIAVKPIDRFLVKLDQAERRILTRHASAHIGVVGGGAGGVELLLSLQRRLSRSATQAGYDPAGLRFTLITATPELLPTFPERMRSRFAEIMTERRIRVITDAAVREVTARGVSIERHEAIALDEVFWTTGAAPAPWLSKTGLALDDEGFVRVGETLQSVSHSTVFAAGDIAALDGYDLPKSGVYAVRSGPPLATNLRRYIEGKPLRAFKPQREALYILTTGEQYAFAARNGFTLEGAWVWRLKDYIDRRFMAKYRGPHSTRAARHSSSLP